MNNQYIINLSSEENVIISNDAQEEILKILDQPKAFKLTLQKPASVAI